MAQNGSVAEDIATLVRVTGTANSTPLVSSYVSAKNCGQFLATLMTGDMASETIDFAIYQATSSGGAGAKSAKAIVQVAASAAANDSKEFVIGMRADELDVDGGFSFVAVRAVTGGATGGTVTMLLQGADLRFAPASLIDNATVLQLVP